jgi:hypothetical protein
MSNPKTDNNNYGQQSDDQERDLGAKGGPTSGLGSPDDKHGISHPYNEDIQTQLAAKSKDKKKKGNNKDK